jgi:hypothetical protein
MNPLFHLIAFQSLSLIQLFFLNNVRFILMNYFLILFVFKLNLVFQFLIIQFSQLMILFIHLLFVSHFHYFILIIEFRFTTIHLINQSNFKDFHSQF